MSGSAIRADPWAHWEALPAPVRPHFSRKICLHGPESTGKSVLAPKLARHFDTIWVPEYGRVHCELNGFELDAAGLTLIADTQRAMTEAALPWCNRRLIVDTDALTTAAWSLMLLGDVPDTIPLAARRGPLPPVRYRRALGRRRHALLPRSRRTAAASWRRARRCWSAPGARWTLISGAWDERFDRAVGAIEAIGPP